MRDQIEQNIETEYKNLTTIRKYATKNPLMSNKKNNNTF